MKINRTINEKISPIFIVSLLFLHSACSLKSPPLLAYDQPIIKSHMIKKYFYSHKIRKRVVIRAIEYMKKPSLYAHGIRFEKDPIGFLRTIYWSCGIDLFDSKVANNKKLSGMEIILLSTRRYKKSPQIGDLVFFRSPKNKKNSTPTQIALIEKIILNQDTIIAIGWFKDGPRRISFNIKYPGEIENFHGRSNDSFEGKKPIPAGKLFYSFSDPF